MPNLKELKADAKSRGLKKYSTLSKDAIIRLIDLDKTGKAPVENMTNKRKKELKTSAKAPIDTLTARVEDFLDDESVERADVILDDTPQKIIKKVKRVKKVKTTELKIPPKPTFKPPKVSRSMLMKRVKAKRNNECSKFADLSKKTISDLKTLL